MQLYDPDAELLRANTLKSTAFAPTEQPTMEGGSVSIKDLQKNLVSDFVLMTCYRLSFDIVLGIVAGYGRESRRSWFVASELQWCLGEKILRSQGQDLVMLREVCMIIF